MRSSASILQAPPARPRSAEGGSSDAIGLLGLPSAAEFVEIARRCSAVRLDVAVLAVRVTGLARTDRDALRRVSETLVRRFQQIDGTIAITRRDGDGFLLLVQCATVADAKDRAADIRRATRTKVAGLPTATALRSSVAIAFFDSETSAGQAISDADGLASRTRVGRPDSTVVWDGPSNHAWSRAQRSFAERLDDGRWINDLVIEHQPIVGRTGIVGGEAFLGVRGPDGSLHADECLAVASELGMLGQVTGAMVSSALHDLRRAGRNLHTDHRWLSIDLGEQQLADESLVPTLLRALADQVVVPERLIVEIDERTLVLADEVTRSTIESLRAVGIGISVDAFGESLGALVALERNPPTMLKLSRRLVADLRTDRAARRLVEATIGRCGELAVAVVADGVESKTVADRLRALGCHLHQGMLTGGPGPLLDPIDDARPTVGWER